MSDFRVDFIDGRGKVFASRELSADTDATAIAEAERLCHRFPQCSAVEVWLGERRVYHDAGGIRRKRPAAAKSGASDTIIAPDSWEAVKRWRDRAEELRRIADQFVSPTRQATLRRTAATYASIADATEGRWRRT